MHLLKKLFSVLFRPVQHDPWAQFEREYEEALDADPVRRQRLHEIGARIALDGGISSDIVAGCYPDADLAHLKREKLERVQR